MTDQPSPCMSNSEDLKSLGNQATEYPDTYNPSVLESFSNKFPKNKYLVTLDCPEFTAVCPKTGQPDFARIEIRYCPDALLVESKSLKLYLFSYRRTGSFHEDCVNKIAADLFALMKPHWIEVYGDFMPRGGIAIKPLAKMVREDSTGTEGR